MGGLTQSGHVDVSIVTSGHDVADARIHRLCAAFADLDLHLELLGLGELAQAPPGVETTTAARPGRVGRALLAVRFAIRAKGTVLVALDPDSLLASLAVSRVRRRHVVADVHEDYAALLSDRAWASGLTGSVAQALVRVASATARRADLVIVADEHVPPHRARRRVVLRNLPYLGMLPEPTEPTLPPRALYIGDVRTSRGLWSMIGAIEQAPGWTLDLVGPVSGADRARVDAYLESGAARDRVTFHGRMPPRTAWRLAAGAAVGLVLLEDTPAFRAALPSKLYEYVASGLPAIVTDLPRQRDFVQSHEVGAVVAAGASCAQETAALLASWSHDPSGLAAARNRTFDFRVEAADWERAYRDAAAAVAGLAGIRPTSGG